MDGKELELNLAKSMHWNFSKLSASDAPAPWKALEQERRVVWMKMARRAIKRIEELKQAPDGEEASPEAEVKPAEVAVAAAVPSAASPAASAPAPSGGKGDTRSLTRTGQSLLKSVLRG